MREHKSVIIIGAGIGGIATSIHLAKNGFQVHVYEKNASPGGRCSQLIRDNHRFDLGATILLMPSVYRAAFRSMGLKFEDCFDLKKLPVIYKVHFGQNRELSFSNNNEFMKSQLEMIEPGSYSKYLSYIIKGYTFFEIAIEKLLSRNFFNLYEFIKPGNIPLLINLKTYISHRKYVKRFFRDPDLRRAFSFQNIYVGQSPNNSPALFAMLPAAELLEGAFFPVGGMYRIVEQLTSIAAGLGVQFYFNSRIDKIQTSGDRALSILLNDGSEKTAELFVVNADLPYAYSSLLPDKKISYRISKMKFACSAIVFYWALDKIYPGLEHHNVFLSDDYDHNLTMIFNKKSIAENPSFYIQSPARTDPSAAPVGGDSLTIIVPSGHIDDKHPQSWDSLKKTARSSIINRLKKTGMGDIEDHIKFEMCYTPVSWENMYNVSRGSVFGSLSHSILQMGYFRPHNRHDRYKNLFFTGGSTHPGNGIPLVLLSAKLTSERILKEFAL